MSSSEIRPFKETVEHSYHRRAFKHNYYAPFIYHIILKKQDNSERFGEVAGDVRIPYGSNGCAYINESTLGSIISKEIIHLPYKFPIIKLHQFKVMPDHVHILLEVKDWSPVHLDYYIDALRDNIANKYSKLKGEKISNEEIFQIGYCDKPLLLKISLDGWYNYIRLNPHRLAMRIQFPEFFQRVDEIKIGDKIYSSYGNQFLLTNPCKEAVIIHRRYTSQEIDELRQKWLSTAVTGGVLISPFISPSEKKIRDEAENLGAKFILIQDEPFREKFKPAKHNFELCSQGRLLIIAPKEPMKEDSFRGKCIKMNNLAETIAKT